ncbi:MAG: hypothetical protein H7141_05145 [Burkholderiales bacterium]|nr:hypothetical protein [Bacteroidia bacterium]
MKKENKEMLKLIISNQERIMKALKIETPAKIEKTIAVQSEEKKLTTKKHIVKKPVKKAAKKK